MIQNRSVSLGKCFGINVILLDCESKQQHVDRPSELAEIGCPLDVQDDDKSPTIDSTVPCTVAGPSHAMHIAPSVVGY